VLPPADMTSMIRPTTAAESVSSVVSVADTRREAFSRLAQIALGQELQGKVLSRFTDGTHLVHIANTAARMNLPANVNVGDSLMLKLVSKDPRPTFLLSETTPGNASPQPTPPNTAGARVQVALQQSAAGNIVQQQPLPTAQPTVHTGATPQQSTATTLSPAAKLIDTLLQAAQQGNMSNAIGGSTPLYPNTSTQTAMLANNLRQAIQLSGVFYESHVAQWATGKRTIEDLQKEPQAQLRSAARGGSIDILQRVDPGHSQMGQIINLQLNVLEQHRLIWQGQAWPGQDMHWEIIQEENNRQKQHNAEEDDPVWQSTVRFNFKHLGGVEASIHLIGEQIHIKINTDNADTVDKLNSHTHLLKQSMLVAGSPLDTLTVIKND
jgi:hypothetical protein